MFVFSKVAIVSKGSRSCGLLFCAGRDNQTSVDAYPRSGPVRETEVRMKR